MSQFFGFLGFLFFFTLIMAGYFLPSIIAFKRKIEFRWLVLIANTMFGGTGIGWFVALVYAVSTEPEPYRR